MTAQRVVIVTGAAGDIGDAIAAGFARRGDRVVGTDLASAWIKRGEVGEELDVTNGDAWTALVENVLARYGRIDVLVNNAGINDRKSIAEASEESFQATFAVNTLGPLLGMQRCVPHMASNGAVINVASAAALEGHSFAVYAASKWALRGLTRSAALEFASADVRVNAICPGLVVTGINRGQAYLRSLEESIPLGRAGTAEEVAALAVWLASDEAAYVTGQDFVVDGGMTSGRVIAR